MSDIWRPGDPMPVEVDRFTFFNWITDTIAITSYDAACDRQVLDIEGVEFIISIGELSPSEEMTGRKARRFPGIRDAVDDNDREEISEAVRAIREASWTGKTLVHCAAGISRSPGLVALALCLDRGWSWERAKGYVKGKRDIEIHHILEPTFIEWLSENR